MVVERLGNNKVRIFISYEDLEERGIDRDEIWQNGRKVQELFWDMMERAYVEVGFEVMGPIAVEAFTMPTEGVVVIVTQVPSIPEEVEKDKEESDTDEHIVMVDPSTAFTFVFDDFENVLAAAKVVHASFDLTTSLYHYRDRYFLFIDEETMDQTETDALWAILHEYGTLSNVTKAVLDEYGKLIVQDTALETLTQYFTN
ncbi:adaptor protein MecA [Effusibacillus lacus]|uniref:Adapter protein MecA n=1 Tax=Effusibacillus lacus TaxID=1348429 RepID=A0A292YKZ2_9BACL|nr:adaptor protein MecA [Effusibacillus lacus]TCS73207.1 adapter protein MecA 1/2 [Effusibacillus lacus]GAX90608.1 adapter protein MecA [Effusibacillus lacus]